MKRKTVKLCVCRSFTVCIDYRLFVGSNQSGENHSQHRGIWQEQAETYGNGSQKPVARQGRWDCISFLLLLLLLLHRVSKNVPPSTCYSLDIHDPITIIFDRSVTGKVRNQTMLCFLTSPIEYFCITLRNKKPRRQRTGALCRQHSPTAAALWTSFLLNHAPNSPYSWTHWLQNLGSHTAAWVWVVSRRDWRNQAAGWIQAMH